MIFANWVGIWLWGLAMWFFFVAAAAHFSSVTHHRLHFAMNWYSFVFPNTALTTATFAVSNALDNNRAFAIVGCVLTVALVITWIFVFGMMIRAVVLKQILWPQMQEDRNEGGWKENGRRLSQQEAAINFLQAAIAVSTPLAEELTEPIFKTRTVGDIEKGEGVGLSTAAVSTSHRDMGKQAEV